MKKILLSVLATSLTILPAKAEDLKENDSIKGNSDVRNKLKEIQKKKEVKKETDVWGFLPDVVASVGDKKINKEGFLIKIEQAKKGNPYLGMMLSNEESAKKIASQMIEGIIGNYILLEIAKQAGYKIDKEAILKDFDAQMKMLSAVQLDQFKKQLATAGKTIESYKAEMTNDQEMLEKITTRKYISEKIYPTIKIEKGAVEKFYAANKEKYFKQKEQVSASHILITPEGAKKEAITQEAKKIAKDKIEKILAQIKNGEDFAELAKENSSCPSSAKGGDLGAFGKGQMVPAFEKVAYALKEGEISDIVETQFGFHIIKAGKKIAGGYVELSSNLKARIMQQLQQQEVQTQIGNLIKEAKKTIDFKIYL